MSLRWNMLSQLFDLVRDRFLWKWSYAYMERQIPTTKMTVWYVRRDYVFRVNSHFVGETLPKKSQRWISHFSSYLVIDLFLCKTENQWILLLFQYNKYFYYFNITQRGYAEITISDLKSDLLRAGWDEICQSCVGACVVSTFTRGHGMFIWHLPWVLFCKTM